MDEPVWDPAHVEEKTVPVFVVLILAGDEGHHSHSTILVESSTGYFAGQAMNGSPNDLDCILEGLPLRKSQFSRLS